MKHESIIEECGKENELREIGILSMEDYQNKSWETYLITKLLRVIHLIYE